VSLIHGHLIFFSEKQCMIILGMHKSPIVINFLRKINLCSLYNVGVIYSMEVYYCSSLSFIALNLCFS
jgi:hypothetical protein